MELIDIIDERINEFMNGERYVSPFDDGIFLAKDAPFGELVHSWNVNYRESMHGNKQGAGNETICIAGHAAAVCAAIELEMLKYGIQSPKGLVGTYLREERILSQACKQRFTRQSQKASVFRKQMEEEMGQTASRDMLRRVIYCMKLENALGLSTIVSAIEKAEYHSEQERRELEMTLLTLKDRKFPGIDLKERLSSALLSIGKREASVSEAKQEIILTGGKWHSKSRRHKTHSCDGACRMTRQVR